MSRVDPTETKTLRERKFRPALTTRFRELKGDIREKVGYGEDFLELTAAEEPYRFPENAGKQEEFRQWLREQIQQGVLVAMASSSVQQGNHYTATYVKAAARKGWVDASMRLIQNGIDIGEGAVEPSFDLPVEKQMLADLYSRAYRNLNEITDDMADEIREELTLGVAEGVSPREMASRINDRVDKVGITRAERLARTEVIHAYNDSAIRRYQRAGVRNVGVDVEWSSARDNRVCPVCETLDGNVYSLDGIRSQTFRYEASEDEPDSLTGDYPVVPPAHPNCRCSVKPIT